MSKIQLHVQIWNPLANDWKVQLKCKGNVEMKMIDLVSDWVVFGQRMWLAKMND